MAFSCSNRSRLAGCGLPPAEPLDLFGEVIGFGDGGIDDDGDGAPLRAPLTVGGGDSGDMGLEGEGGWSGNTIGE